MQVCELDKPLLSVSRLVSMVNKVVFGAAGSYVESHKTKETVWTRESNGMFARKLWVRGNEQRPFPRQGCKRSVALSP